jgi:hypothetical protein
MKLDPYSLLKNAPRMHQRTKCKAKTIKFLGRDLCSLGGGNGFLDMTPKTQATNLDKLDFVKN